jgi:Cys-rich peptide (TIGR04165 family)
MKTEDLVIECPECGSKDKRISRTRDPTRSQDAFLIPHIPEGSCGVIKCNKCGHVFEYCRDHPMPMEVKKKLI